jgi:Ni/Fe-hydrogenase subunit HybB-like protein
MTFVYWPSWVEWSLMAGCFAAFALLYMGFTKLFPIISMWELEPVGVAHAHQAATAPAASPALTPVEASS